MTETYDLAVIGAGPAGLEAAIAASKENVKTVLIDHAPQAGGQYYMPLPSAFRSSRKTETEEEGETLVGRLNQTAVTRLYNTLVWGIFRAEDGEGWLIDLNGPDSPRRLQAHTVILANGAYDTPVAFPGWTLPGVLTCGAALTLLKNQRTAPFKRVLVTGAGPLLFSAAAHLIDAGVEVVAVCEANRLRAQAVFYGPTFLREWHRVKEGAHYLTTMLRGRAPYKMGWSVLEARGKGQVEEAIIGPLNNDQSPIPGRQQTFQVDAVICGYGLTPNTGLARMAGCQMEYAPQKGGWIPWRDETLQTNLPGIFVVGDGAGIGGAENARLEGQVAGVAAALKTGHVNAAQAAEFNARIQSQLTQQRRYGRMLAEFFSPKAGLLALAHDETLVCRCEGITLGEVKAAVAAGARSIGEVKMITRVGMGNCQGRMCERSVAEAVLQQLIGEGATPESVGAYVTRPPLFPLPIGSFVEPDVDGKP